MNLKKSGSINFLKKYRTIVGPIHWKRILPQISIVVLIAFLNMIIGCNYYKINSTYKATAEFGTDLVTSHRDVIVHLGSDQWKFNVLEFRSESIIGKFKSVSVQHLQANQHTRSKRYKHIDKHLVLNVVHIYINEYVENDDNTITIPLNSIERIEIYDQDTGSTVASWVFSSIGVTIGVLAIVGVIILLTKSSCPFIYTYDGIGYNYIGEIYSGAIYPTLERDDYLPLPNFKPVNNKYQLKISNELKERQYTNLAELMVVTHPGHTQILLDKYGMVQTLSELQIPLSAISSNGNDYMQSVRERDSDYYLFNDYNEETKMSSVMMTFQKPDNVDKGKLVIKAKNSLWGDYTYGQFTKLFGSYYNKWVEKQSRISAKRHNNKALKHGIPISVYLETDMGWTYVDYFNLVGPLGARDLVMPIDFSDINSEQVKLKLECGFMFWELDYAAMDYSENIAVELTTLKPESASNIEGNDVKNLLCEDDNQYLEQLMAGNEAVIRYNSPEFEKNTMQTVFLHSKGHYQPIRHYGGKPDIRYLRTFRMPGALSEFSWKRYSEVCKENGILVKR